MRPATCRHDPGCGSEMACIARGAYEGEGYRRQADERARWEREARENDWRHDALYIAKRTLKAIEDASTAIQRLADHFAPEPSAEERAARDRLKPR